MIIIMQNFDINNSQMQENKLTHYQRFQRSFHNYYFEYPERRPLNLHQSHLSQTALIVIRIVAFVYITGIYLWALIEMPTFNTNIIYLTMLGYTATWLYFALSLQDYFINSKSSSPLSESLHKVVELLYETALCTQIPITLIFWTLLFQVVLDMPNVTTSEIVLQSNLHAIPLLFLAIDFSHNTFCFHIRHISLLAIFVVIYLIINMTYSLSVKPIYKPIPWNDVASYIISIGCILAVLLIHYIARLIFRRWKLKKLQQKGAVAQKFLEKSDYSQLEEENSSKQNKAFRKTIDL